MTTPLPFQRQIPDRCAKRAPGPSPHIAILALLAILAFAGCTPAARTGASVAEQAALEEQALALSQTGDHGAARQVYLSLARRAASAERAYYRIMAAREAGRDGFHRRALDELQSVEAPPQWLGLWSLAAAESERPLNGSQAAYIRLAAIDASRFPDLAGELVRARSELLFDMGRAGEALDELTRLGADFSEGGERTAEFAWSLLREHRKQLSTTGVAGIPLGWIELALLAERLAGDPTEASAALAEWRAGFPGHPAASLLDDTVRDEVCRAAPRPARLALLLPGSGSYNTALRSLRDGFMAASYALGSSCTAPEVVFYEVDRSEDAAGRWTLAAAEGADFIVGPLLPESVQSAAQVADGLPTLALNRLRGQAPPAGFEQYALAPEHEARQAAREALVRGLRRALILHPDSAWGRRIQRSFLDEYLAGGGKLVAREPYTLTAVDYSEPIGRLLKIGASNRRARELGQKLGRRLEFEPRRREDADLVFLVARSAKGQLLVPQLRYNYSGDLPVFSIQSIFDADQPDNRDLNGIEIPALPVVTHQHLQMSYGQLSGTMLAAGQFNASLFAMGYDSFKLALALFGGGEALATGIRGLTGTIYRSPGGSLERQLAWTRIIDGKLTVIQATP